jgi:uncharacterized protein (TIGR02646 family)
MAIFARRETPPTYPDVRSYLPHLRNDFISQCAYCERTEAYFGGQEAFEVDHFRPSSRFPELSYTYSNLYYVCSKCNRHKSNTWPSNDQMSRGARFADPCEEDPYLDHLREADDGGVEELTPCGEYSNAHIRLDRSELRTWRTSRAQARKDLPHLVGIEEGLRRALLIFPGEHQEIQARLDALRRRIEEIRRRFLIG